jgi:radical SAM modification target selenobiotic family peptide
MARCHVSALLFQRASLVFREEHDILFPMGSLPLDGRGGETMEKSDLKRILAGIAVTSLLAGTTLSVSGCHGNSG